MPAVSDLARLYEAIYRKPPSSHSTAALLAMEELLDIAEDDPLARMLVVLLHVADRWDDTATRITTALERRSEDEQGLVGEVKTLSSDLTRLAIDLQDARSSIRRRHRHLLTEHDAGGAGVSVDTYRKLSPLLSYLRGAFRRRGSVVDDNHAIGAARWDMAWLGIAGFLLLMLGAAIGGQG